MTFGTALILDAKFYNKKHIFISYIKRFVNHTCILKYTVSINDNTAYIIIISYLDASISFKDFEEHKMQDQSN